MWSNVNMKLNNSQEELRRARQIHNLFDEINILYPTSKWRCQSVNIGLVEEVY